ncbi:M20/M25/M40 family metallo-hydrolase [Agarilytica rhodophyticola]|uniref:M20/M25/M40 family metallo-hydrolase n=1 Tax=Agarilytica rhodophyticola TaxID=1737490 RepID=UPI000B34169C|nr:M20/M25/M40 family metallo-hydrolase [Agarilytica rhodophyticola]
MKLSTLVFALALTTLNFGVSAAQTELNVKDSKDKKVWITIGEKAAKTIQSQYSSSVPMNVSKKQFNSANSTLNTKVTVASVSESDLEELSDIMHHEYNRCGGYFFHESLEEAQNYVKSIQNIQPMLVNYTINNPNGVATLLSQLKASNLVNTVNTLKAYHNRYYDVQSGADAAVYIRDSWQTIGASRSDFSVELFNHSWQQPSVIATITGTTSPDEIVVIGGHLDSINGSNRRNGKAPGADDNASGIAVVTETLRAIVASGYKPEKTIKFMGYAAEEVGLRGSNAIAQSFKADNKNVIGVAQFDMSGYQGTSNRDIVFMTDFTNSGQNQFMSQLLDTYHQDIVYGFGQCGYGCSDHASWHNQGFPASMPFESNLSDSNPTIHSSNDSTYDVDHSMNFAKLSVTFIAELAKGGTGSTPTPTPTPTPTVTPIPTPSPNVLINNVPKNQLSAQRDDDIVFTMEVPSSASNINFSISGGSGDADLYVRFGSEPTDSRYDCRPYRNGNNESCNVNQTGGKYYVRVKAYRSFSGLTLIGSYNN